MNETKKIINKIEKLRSKMAKVKNGKAFTHPEVVKASQELDIVLNKYQELIVRDKKNSANRNHHRQ
ncbi:aspartyl-phosphate phosphatase Spo0E family protein [Dehalobacter sp. TeCB1]|uniref:aspartyl-phosphate phosphatase Spo0E family protein n=1 Tax=Dehalobacter sp. TeCB1 TaxID=1843715 RepID=UPI00083B1FFB|nr:aspartyl-phosphate phosphatase Spo0E family protein [Dehalobacter sp. TeCB1]OCZ49847.1 hypothetical protein A7D23_00415 [Dehalobacter sp. TeCB1]